jgi:glutaminyl-peptide cyclotransferase
MRSFSLLVLALLFSLPAVAQDSTIDLLVPEVLDVRPHDPGAFTQGLLLHDDLLYESTGRYGLSTIRQVDPVTGEVLRGMRLPDQIFAEGLALAGEYLYQITWREQVALRYNLSAFTEAAELELETFEYEGEGWGLCYDGTHLYMSDGTDTLALRDPETFEIVEELQVTWDGVPLSERTTAGEPITTPVPDYQSLDPTVYDGQRLDMLNELECVDDVIYSNVWQTDLILQIDRETGAVLAQIDATGLLPEEDQPGADVLNGIAYDPETETFLITGKLWPSLFEVRFVPADE